MRVLRRGMGGPDVKQWQEFLRQQGFDIGTADGSFGERTFRATAEFQSRNGLGSDGVVGPGTVNKAKELGFTEAEDAGGGGGGGGGGSTGGSTGGSGGLTEQALAQIMPNLRADKRATYFPFLARAMEEFEINTPARAAAFIAQLAHESAEFRFMEEIWGPTPAQRRYEGRRDLGNTQTGDGFRFKGRGPIQITGRHNYKKYGDLLGVDLISNPQAAATPEVSFRIAGAYWRENNINAKADRQDIVAITRAINGGTNGLEDRKRYYEKARRVLGVSATRGFGGPAGDTRGVEEEDGPRFTRGLDESGEPVPTAAERSAAESSAAEGAGGGGGAGAGGAGGGSGAGKKASKGGAKKAAKAGAKKAAKKAGSKKAGAKKSAAGKGAGKKAGSKKSAVKKSAARKSASKKSAASRGGSKGASKKGGSKGSKSAAKKGASKKSSGKGASKKGAAKKGGSKKGGRGGR